MLVPARALSIVLCTVVIGAAGCGGDDGAALEDGRHYGYLRGLETTSTPPTASFDEAQFLTGDDANEAAVEDGVIEDGDTVPNDYYVRNADEATVELTVSTDVTVTRVDCDGGCEEGAAGDFEGLAASFDDPEPTLEDDYRGALSQYWVTVEDGAIVAIDEQYLP